MASDARIGTSGLTALESTAARSRPMIVHAMRSPVPADGGRGGKNAHWVFKADFCKDIRGRISPA
jgi:hypothetical protein